MELTLTLDIPALPKPIVYTDSVFLIGSCFTEHISDRLMKHKFRCLSNPHGILFNPISVAHSLDSYVDDRKYRKEDLFYLNELWNSWDHHTRFSNTDQDEALRMINRSQEDAATFIKKTDWVIITLGSAFQYYLTEAGRPVSNNHRAPGQWFEKKLLSIEEIVSSLSKSLYKLITVNPDVKILFTISPVRHIRDGVVDNNRSKARLTEAVHRLCNNFKQAFYFPAYELVIDILRDYRYYDIDFVHPNYLATQYVWEQFMGSCIEANSQKVIQKVHEIVVARAHRARFPETEAHRKFKADHIQKIESLVREYPGLDFSEELKYFSD